MIRAVLKRALGLAARQVEAFERRQDQRMDALGQRVDQVAVAVAGLSQRLDTLDQRVEAATRQQQQGLASLQSSRGEQALEQRLELLRQAVEQQRLTLDQRFLALEAMQARLLDQGQEQQAAQLLGDVLHQLETLGRRSEHDPRQELALELSTRMDALTGAALDQREAIRGLGYQLRTQFKCPGLQLSDHLASVDTMLSEVRLLLGSEAKQGADRVVLHRLDGLDAALSELRLTSSVGDKDGHDVGGLHQRLDGLDATLAELRLASATRDSNGHELGGLHQRLDGLDATLAELRLASATRDSNGHELGGLHQRLDGLDATLAELRLASATRDSNGYDVGGLHQRLDGLEGALAELRLASATRDSNGHDVGGLHQRLDGLEGALSELRVQRGAGSDDADALRRELRQRLEEIEAAMSEMRLPLDRLASDLHALGAGAGSEQGAQLEAMEASLAEQRLVLQRLGQRQELATAQERHEVAQQLQTLEALASEENLAFKQLADSSRDQHLVLRHELDALEASITDQRHALHKLVTSFDSHGYAQRLEFQKRLSALDTELRSMLTAIEANITDQRYTLVKLTAGLNGGAAEQGQGAQAATEQALAGGPVSQIDHKLGIVLDCLLADHMVGLARAGRDAGELDEAAYSRLTAELEELKVERLRSRHSLELADGTDRADSPRERQ